MEPMLKPFPLLFRVCFSLMRRLAFFALIAFILAPLHHASAFGVSPAMMELSGPRGEVLRSTFSIINDKPNAETFYLRRMKFMARDEGGAPQFIPYHQDHAGFPEWIIFDADQIDIPAFTKAEIPFSIAIPSDAASGGHYAAITISEAPYDIVSQGASSVSAQTAILLFLTVAGETHEQAALLDFSVTGLEQALLGSGGQFTYRIQNQGNVHITPTGAITLTDLFGRTLLQLDANEGSGRVLPNTTRTFEISIEPKEQTGVDKFFARLTNFVIGPVTASLNLTYGSTSIPLTATDVTWHFSWPLPVLLIVLVVTAVLICQKIQKKHR